MTIDLNELITEVVKHSYFDGDTIELGNLLALHINTGEEGIDCIDVYKWASAEAMEADDYDFDSDYICTINKDVFRIQGE